MTVAFDSIADESRFALASVQRFVVYVGQIKACRQPMALVLSRLALVRRYTL